MNSTGIFTHVSRQRVWEWASFFNLIFRFCIVHVFFLTIDVAQGYVKEAGVPWLSMWDLTFLLINYKVVFFFF